MKILRKFREKFPGEQKKQNEKKEKTLKGKKKTYKKFNREV